MVREPVNGSEVSPLVRRSSARIQKLKCEKAALPQVRSEKEREGRRAVPVSCKRGRGSLRKKADSANVSPGSGHSKVGEKGLGFGRRAPDFLEGEKEPMGRGAVPVSRKRVRVSPRKKADSANVSPESGHFKGGAKGFGSEKGSLDVLKGGEPMDVKGFTRVENGTLSDAYARVAKALKTFDEYYRQLAQARNALDDSKFENRRPDLKAIAKMIETNAIIYPKSRIGHIPGLDVGHKFFSRAEMVVIGLHNHWLRGIDFIGQKDQSDYAGYKLPLAVAIVLSGQYEDDRDSYEDIIYTGQGGNNLVGDKRQFQHQVMERGNLALKNCIEQDVPVRVVRGHKSSGSPFGKLYTYDGLYKVVKYWAENGLSGFTVYKFKLKRLEGQPLLTSDQVHFTELNVANPQLDVRGLVCEDISCGLEDIPIPVTNLVDEQPTMPAGFSYLEHIQYAQNVKQPKTAPGCDCKGACTNPKSCACARLNDSHFPYVHRDGYRLIEPKAVIFECGPNCGCGPDCVNRTTQQGLRFRLEVFRTPTKGWAVRSWDYIPSGSPVCEYIGVLKKTDEIDTSTENNYIFDIDCLQTMKGLDGREKRLRDVSIPGILENDDETKSDSVPEFCIDAGPSGNVARFINHSCEPNLFVQCVLSAHHDIGLARVVLFSAENIPPLKELTYDYGYAMDSVMGSDGKIRQMPCYCGALGCRGRLF